jgi:predicted  nucleic acid-binding Zn-ribbon protein
LLELGHTLLGRISSLEKRETKHAAELSDVKKKHESLNSEYNALLNRFKNLDEINVAVKNERNKLSLELQEMRQSLIKYANSVLINNHSDLEKTLFRMKG